MSSYIWPLSSFRQNNHHHIRCTVIEVCSRKLFHFEKIPPAQFRSPPKTICFYEPERSGNFQIVQHFNISYF